MNNQKELMPVYIYYVLLHRVEVYDKSSWAFVHHNLYRNWEIAAQKLRKKGKNIVNLNRYERSGMQEFAISCSQIVKNDVIFSFYSVFFF